MTFILSLGCFFLIRQTSELIPTSIHIFGVDMTPFDVLTAMVFMHWVGPYIFAKPHPRYIQVNFNKLYFKFLLVGLIPILVGLTMGKGNPLYAYRFFFYFVWVPVLFDYFQDRKKALKALKVLVAANFLSVLLALITRIVTLGFTLGYVQVHYELNLFITLLMFSMVISKEKLFNKEGLDLLILITSIVAIIIDHSRKMYLALLIGAIMLIIFQIRFFNNRHAKKTALAITVSVVLIVGSLGLWNKVLARFSTVFISPSQIQTFEGVDTSGAFRLYALLSGLQIVKENPVFGVGSGDAIEMSRAIMLKYGHTISLSPHNFYLSMTLYYGIPIVLWVYYEIFRFIMWSFRETISSRSPFFRKHRAISLGMITGYSCFLFSMFFEGFGVDTIFDKWILLGLMLGFTYMHTHIASKQIEERQCSLTKKKI